MTASEYLAAIETNLRAGNATEHTHRPALERFLNGLAPGIRATNEPKRSDFGAIDFVVSRTGPGGTSPVGYVEAKDVGVDLTRVEASEQLRRYRRSLHNLVLTDYLEFRWYLDGDLRATARLGVKDASGRIKREKDGATAVRALLDGFLAQAPPRLGSPRELAERLAELTHTLRDQVLSDLQNERIEGNLHGQLQAFRRTLLPGLEPGEFADMYAQTIAYGLFAARAAAPESTFFTRHMAPDLLPQTNPFLVNFFGHLTGTRLDPSIAWIVDALAALLSRADMEAVLRDFGRRTRQEDPVVHFYETFLAKYDPKMREMRGVYYTPEPVVSYIVRSVDALLKTQLGRPRGLADPDTIILDPAVGTGTFLYTIVNEIHQGFVARNDEGQWESYVAQKLICRLFGFELLMAPYAIAHLKLGLLLRELGYEARDADERLGVYLTNTLAEGVEAPPIPFAGYISDEANAATAVKRDKPIMVVIGNPPYSGHSANKGEWIGGLVRDYYFVDGRPLGERNPKWLQDDYVKFLRFGQWRVSATGQGILAFISNNGYLDNPTFRGMRRSLLNTFSRIYIIDLHGNSRKRERTPEGGPDENVFDIMQGVAIALFVKEPGKATPAQVYHADLWGTRKSKYDVLFETDASTTGWSEVVPRSPNYLFTPQDIDLSFEYERGWKVTSAMPVNVLGFQSHRDNFATDLDETRLRARILDLRGTTYADDELRIMYSLRDNRDWQLSVAREQLRTDAGWQRHFVRCLYRPLDWRWCYYSTVAMDYSRRELIEHVVCRDNICLNTMRQTKAERWRHALVSDTAAPAVYVEIKDGSNIFPLYLYPDSGQVAYHRSDAIEAARKAIRAQEGLSAREQTEQLNEITELVRRLYPREEYPRWPNLAPRFIADIEERLGLPWAPDGRGDLVKTFGPEDVFNYMYAVLHSPTYRSRYAPFLKSDFPRVPLTRDVDLFRDLAALGAELVDLHLMRAPGRETETVPVTSLRAAPSFPKAGDSVVEKVTYDGDGRVFINKTQHFAGVSPEVWEFHIGGYQVCEKWLKDRKGRSLSYDDIEHYKGIVTALGRTIELMAAIDARIPAWPLA